MSAYIDLILRVSFTHHYRCKCNVLRGNSHKAIHFPKAVVPGLFITFNVFDVHCVGAKQYVDEYL
jgi:hypothetical protein